MVRHGNIIYTRTNSLLGENTKFLRLDINRRLECSVLPIYKYTEPSRYSSNGQSRIAHTPTRRSVRVGFPQLLLHVSGRGTIVVESVWLSALRNVDIQLRIRQSHRTNSGNPIVVSIVIRSIPVQRAIASCGRTVPRWPACKCGSGGVSSPHLVPEVFTIDTLWIRSVVSGNDGLGIAAQMVESTMLRHDILWIRVANAL
ncbi:hypothetical protein P152DRAFT_209993 [Eremomyces bilateralis CBS 781.70]|uniref:Uncharacterized protein n=1 Tax=Eremomyces bilateralis CBS 781.70 TaxID=1392243 RepID=A0A6G1FSG6_9PEZI|nr:uncharacterized protein P152DRAFT_209993 [Eremomyces bilateralis CBS 781.70]KAF1808805.1 hypothetical protein P152DRAFT_209993 [Eremomyces bilateralis CBS 781.70]